MSRLFCSLSSLTSGSDTCESWSKMIPHDPQLHLMIRAYENHWFCLTRPYEIPLFMRGVGWGGIGWVAVTVGIWLQWESLLNWETHHSPQSRSGDGTKTPDEMIIPRIQLFCKTPPTLSKFKAARKSGRLNSNFFSTKKIVHGGNDIIV